MAYRQPTPQEQSVIKFIAFLVFTAFVFVIIYAAIATGAGSGEHSLAPGLGDVSNEFADEHINY